MDINLLRAPSHLFWLPTCPYTADVRLWNWKNRNDEVDGPSKLEEPPRSGQPILHTTIISMKKNIGPIHPKFHPPSFYTGTERGESGS